MFYFKLEKSKIKQDSKTFAKNVGVEAFGGGPSKVDVSVDKSISV